MPTKTKLAEMALDAAMVIERVQRHENQDLERLTDFVDALESQLDGDQGLTLRDETMFPFYSFALARAANVDRPTRNQFPNLMRRMLEKQRREVKQPGELEQIKVFCLAFHEAMVRAVHSNRPMKQQFDGRVR